MRTVIPLLALAILAAGRAAAQSAAPGQADVLAHVRIDRPVLANGQPLAAGTYDVRLTNDPPTADDERRVEFVTNGTVAGRDVATVLRADDRPPDGASAARVRDGVRVDLLKGGEFLRISVTRGGERYLIYLPVAPQ